MAHDYKKQVQQDVDQAGDGQIVQRTLRIAHGAKDGRAEGVEHVSGHSKKINLHIQRCAVDDVLRVAHEGQQGTRQHEAQHAHQHAADARHDDGSMHALMHGAGIVCAIGPGNDNACAHAKAHEYVDNQVDQCAGGAHGGQRLRADELADHDHIRGVVQQLQYAGEDQGQGEAENLWQQRAAAHVHFIVAGITHRWAVSFCPLFS